MRKKDKQELKEIEKEIKKQYNNLSKAELNKLVLQELANRNNSEITEDINEEIKKQKRNKNERYYRATTKSCKRIINGIEQEIKVTVETDFEIGDEFYEM